MSDCSVGKFERQVGKKGSQVGKFEGQVVKIALQVGITILWKLERRVSPTEKAFGGAKSSNKFFNKTIENAKGRPRLYPRPPFFYIVGDDSLINQKDWDSV